MRYYYFFVDRLHFVLQGAYRPLVYCPLPPKGGSKSSLVIKPPLPLRGISPKGGEKIQ